MASQHRPWEVVVVGGAYTDYVARGPRLPGKGEDVRGDIFHELPGGKGFNQAVAAARLGARVAFVGCMARMRAVMLLQRRSLKRASIPGTCCAPTRCKRAPR